MKHCMALLLLSVCATAQTYTFSTLYSFPKGGGSGSAPCAPTIDAQGNIYGVTDVGGKYGYGTVWKVSSKGVHTLLYSFGSTKKDELEPCGWVERDSSGNLYGQSGNGGGTLGYGAIWKLTAAGKESLLYSFTQSTGYENYFGSMALDSSGNLYGYAGSGIFKLTSKGVFSTLYSSSGGGSGPVLYNGNLIGSINTGGPDPQTLVWSLSTDGQNYSTFSNGIYIDPPAEFSGNLYGTGWSSVTQTYGIFEINSEGAQTTLYTFPDDIYPYSSPVLDSSGNIYGVTTTGGGGDETVYQLTPEGEYTTLHTAGAAGLGYGIVIDSGGNLYGTNDSGGSAHQGVVWKLTKVQ